MPLGDASGRPVRFPAVNALFLWVFGPEIEDAMGRARYLVFDLLGGLAATAAQIAVDPTSTVPSLGASGAIAAVLGALLGAVAGRWLEIGADRPDAWGVPRR